MDPQVRLEVRSGFTDTPFCPVFEPEVIAEDERTRTVRDHQGVVKRDRLDSVESSMSQFLEFPVKARDDWEALKWRLRPETPERYPANWQEVRKRHEGRSYPLEHAICGLYGLHRNLLGEESLAYTYYDDPEMLHDMARTWVELNIGIADRAFAEVLPDYIFIWEDMAFKNGPLISPDFFRKFMLPYYAELNGHFRSLGIETIFVDSDGNPMPIMSLFVEGGVNAFLPIEAAAGMDPVAIREIFGRKLILWGGIDKRELSKDSAAVEREVMSKVPYMLKSGGYIPSVDHTVPPDIPFHNYTYFVKLVRDLGKEHGG